MPSLIPSDDDRPADRPALGFMPDGHRLAAEFDQTKLDPFPKTRERYDALIREAGNETKRRNIRNVLRALLEHKDGGGTDFGPGTIGALTQRMGGPSIKALSNASSSHHRALMKCFSDEASKTNRAPRAKPNGPGGVYDELVRKLDKPHHRAVIRDLVTTCASLRKQVEILKAQVQLARPTLVSLRPAATQMRSAPVPERNPAPSGATLTEAQKATVRRALDPERLRREGMELVDGAVVLTMLNRRLFSPGFVKAAAYAAGIDLQLNGGSPSKAAEDGAEGEQDGVAPFGP